MNDLFSQLNQTICSFLLFYVLQQTYDQENDLLITRFLLNCLMAKIQKRTDDVSQQENIALLLRNSFLK